MAPFQVLPFRSVAETIPFCELTAWDANEMPARLALLGFAAMRKLTRPQT
jgi:hypothetical protein